MLHQDFRRLVLAHLSPDDGAPAHSRESSAGPPAVPPPPALDDAVAVAET
jgi:hypothetical protein